MNMGNKINPSRRSALKKIAGSAAVAIAGVSLSHRLSATEAVLDEKTQRKNKSFGVPMVLQQHSIGRSLQSRQQHWFDFH
jgi:hypothetical protein